MVSLDDAVIARFKKGEDRFEILVDPYLAADLLDGKEIDVLKILAIDTIFNDSKKGTHASNESLHTIFGTNNVTEIATKIIKKGEISL